MALRAAGLRPDALPSSAATGVLLDVLVDVEAEPKLGTATRVETVGYRNPIEVALGGSGFLVLGVAAALRFVRDYATTRRAGAAKAEVARAHAQRENLRTDLFRWLVGEVQSGRLLVPPADLLRLLTDADTAALDALAQGDVGLHLPDAVPDVASALRGRRAG